MATCDVFEGQFCANAGGARHGLIITESATIEFHAADDGLQLVVQDRMSQSETVLDLLRGAQADPVQSNAPIGGPRPVR